MNRVHALRGIAVGAMLLCATSLLAVTYTSTQSGPWNDANTWGGGGFPISGDAAIITANHTVTVTGNELCLTLTFDSTNGNKLLVVDTGAMLIVERAIHPAITINAPLPGSTNILRVNDGGLLETSDSGISITGGASGAAKVEVLNTGIARFAGDVTFGGTAANAQLDFGALGGNVEIGGDLGNGGTLVNNAGSTVTFNGTGAQTINGYTFNHLTVNKGGGTATLNGPIQVNGDLNVPMGTLDDGGNQISLNGGGTSAVTVGSVGILKLGSAANATFFPTPHGTVTLSGGSAVVYQAGAQQTIQSDFTYDRLYLSTMGPTVDKILSGASLTVNGELNISKNGLNNVTLDLGTGTLDANGDISGDGTVTITAGSVSIAGNWGSAGTLNAGTGTVTYDGNGSQSMIDATYADLVIAKSGGIAALSGNTTVNDDFTVTSGTFDAGANTLFLLGDFTNAGTVAATNATFKLNGTSPQTWSSPSAINLTGLEVNNAAGVSMSGNVGVAGSFVLGGGILTTSSNVFVDVAATVTRTSGWVAGELTMGLNPAPARRFHLGTASAYLPVDVDAGTMGAVALQANEGQSPDRTADNVLQRYWTLGSSSVTGFDSITFNYNQTDVVTGDETQYILAHYDGGSQVFTHFGVVNAVTNSVSATGPAVFVGDWIIGQPGSLAAASKLAITSVNGGVDPQDGVPFNVVVEAQDDDGDPTPVFDPTNVQLTLFTGGGILSGTSTGTIPAATDTITISGVEYTPAESGVVIQAAVTAGDPLASGVSAAFNVTSPPSTLTVSSIADSGPGTLRDAITTANAAGCSTPCTINFTTSGSINLASALPAITAADLTIDGFTATGASANTNAFGLPSNAVITIAIDGTSSIPVGFDIQTTGVKIQGFAVKNFFNGGSGIGIRLSGANTGTIISGCSVGTDMTGTSAQANAYGVLFTGSTGGATLGGFSAAARNLISGNTLYGIKTDSASTGIALYGNYVGPNAALTAPIANNTGIYVCSGCGVTVGASSAGNVISGNTATGLVLAGSSNTVRKNYIGTAGSSNLALPNATGIQIDSGANANTLGGPSPSDPNTISGNTQNGILINGDDTIIDNNVIGLAPDGTTAMGNGGSGIRLENNAARNLIGTSFGNKIVYNANDGVTIATNGTGIGNVVRLGKIAANTSRGIDIDDDGTTANDATDSDTGANNRQNFPVINEATYAAGTVSVKLSMNSSAGVNVNFYRFDVYKADGSSPNQAVESLGNSGCVAGNVFSAFAFNVSAGTTVVGNNVVATATAYSDAACSSPSEGTSELSPGVRVGGDIHWIAGSGNWESAANWNPAVVPTSADNAYIDNPGTYTVTINSIAAVASVHVGVAGGTQTLSIPTAQSLTFSAASTVGVNGVVSFSGLNFGGTGNLDVAGTMNWSTGTITGAGGIDFNSGSTLNINTASGKVLTGSSLITIDSGATANWTGGGITLSSGGAFDNFGTFEITTDASISDGGGAGTFDNNGLFRKIVTGGATSFTNVVFNHNAGTVDIQTGRLNPAGGTAASAFTIGSGADVFIDGDTYTFAAGASSTGVGKVHITGGTLNVTGPSVLMDHLLLDAGTLGGAGTARTGASGNWVWSGGTMSGAGQSVIETGSSISIGTASAKSLATRTLTIQTGANAGWFGTGAIQLSTGGNIANAGTFDIQDNAAITDAGTAGAFVNIGTFKKSAGVGTTSFTNVTFTNNATVQVQTGTLNPSTMTSTGPIQLTGTLLVDDSTVTLNAGTDVSGTGLLRVNGGTLAANTVDTFPNVQLDGGFFQGTAAVSVESLAWNGGVMQGAGTTTIPALGTATIAGPSGKSLQRTFSIANTGTCNVTGTGTVNFSNGGNIVNDGTLEVTALMAFSDAGSGGDINNTRTFRTSSGGTTSLVGITLNNTGGVALADVVSGTLNLADGTSSGQFAIAAGANVLVDSDTYTFATGTTVTGSGSVDLTGGTLLVTGNVSVPTFTQNGGTLDGSGTLTLTGASSTWSTGTMQGGGTTAIANAATLTLSGFSAKALNNRTLSTLSGGTIAVTGGGAVNLLNGGNVANAGNFNVTANNNFNDAGSGGNFVNTGTFTKSTATGPTIFTVGFTNNGGLVDLQSGTVSVNGDVFTQSSGTLKLWLNGTTPGTGFAQLSTNTTPNLAGTLQIALVGIYQPNGGDTFNVVNASAVSGDFTQPYTYPALAGGRTFSDAYTPSGLVLTVVGNGDLSISKAAPSNVLVGAPIAYTLTVNNAGPDSATSVSVTDVLQTGHTFITAGGTGWTCNVVSLTVTCTAASLPTGTAPAITINANAPATPQTFTNVANVSSSNDPTPGNNSGSAIVTVDPNQADLDVTSSVSPATPVATATPVQIDFAIQNDGPQTATNVVFTATVPAGLTYTSAVPDSGLCNFAAGTITCNVGNIANGATLHVYVNLTTGTTGTHTVNGSATATEGDPVPANNATAPQVQVTGSTLTVTNTNDTGAGSLRQAMTDANGGVCTPLPCIIAFNIAAGPFVIAPQSDLPALASQIAIDATTQPGYAGVPIVELDGSLPATAVAFSIAGNNSAIRGLSIRNETSGIDVNGNGNTIEANYIGITPAEAAAPNTDGIRVFGSNNTIQSNAIAHNGASGVAVLGGTGNKVSSNAMHDNGALGIDLAGDGVTPNDAGDPDSGPNNLQNAPTLTGVTLTGGGNVQVNYTLDSSATPTGSMRLEFFRADGAGEGEVFLGSTCVAGNFFTAAATFNAPGLNANDPVVATATAYTDGACTTVGDGTSEFSNVVNASACVPPVVTITGPTAFCAGSGPVTLDAGAGFASYSWNTGATTRFLTVNPGSTTTYTVTATTALGCSNSDSHTVTVNPLPVVAIAGPTSVCSGGSVTLNAGPGFSSYAWSNGATSQSITVSPAGNTTYTVTVTDGNTCAASDSHAVTVTTNPVVTIAGPTDMCTGSSVTLDAGPGFASYSWSNGATSQSILVSPASTTTYSVTVSDGSCNATDSHTVTVNTTPTATITAGGPTNFCAGGSVTLTAGNGTSWLWNNGATTQSINVTSSGSFSVQVFNGSCSATSAPATVTVNPAPAVTITGPTATCAAAPVVLDAGPGFASYSWSNGATSQTITVNPAATTTYSVTVSNGTCTATDSHTVTVSSNPVATITAPAGICESSNNPASVAAQAGASFVWTITNGAIVSGQGTNAITFNSGTSGNVSLAVTVTAGSCTSNGNVVIPISPRPSVVITAPVSATPSQAGLAASVPAQPGATYNWSAGNGSVTSGNGTNAITFTAGASGVTTLAVTVTIGSCSDNNTHHVFIDAPQGGTDADLAITKSAPATVQPGGTIVYTINVANLGTIPATDVVINDSFPAGTSFVSVNGGPWNCTRLTSSIRCTGTAAPSSNGAIALTLTAPQSGTVVNTADVLSSTADPNSANNAASATTTVVTAPPTCSAVPPSLQLPASGATVTSPVTFTWSAVNGATEYELWINDSLAATTAATTLTRASESGLSTWFVIARLGNGCDPLTSATRTFIVPVANNCPTQAPQITAPAHGATVSSPVTIFWTPVPQAIGYRVGISANGAATEDAGVTDAATTSLIVSLPAGSVAVYVDALFSGCEFKRSSLITVNVPAPDPCAARANTSPLTPANNSVVNSSSVQFTWMPVANADGYRLWFSLDGGEPAVLGTTTEETSLRASIGRGTVVWWLETLFGGCASVESQPFRFTIPARTDCTNARAELLAPARNATTNVAGTTFAWTAVPNAVSYELWVSVDNSTPALFGTTTGTSMTGNVPPGTIDWSVIAVVDRCGPRESQQSRFTYAPPANCASLQRANLIEPLDGADVNAPVSFSWYAAPGATSYGVYVIRGGETSLVATTSQTEANGVNLAAGRMHWFVRANFGGACSPLDSEIRDLAVVAAPPACSVLAAPSISAPGQISSDVPFLIQWTPVSGATSYQLQIADNPEFGAAQTITTAGTQHQLTRSNNGDKPLAVYLRVRAVDGRCRPLPAVSPYGNRFVLFILPWRGNDGSIPLSGGTIRFEIPLGPELAGQTFTAVPKQSWLSVSPASGVVGPNGTAITVTAATATLPVGTSLGGVIVTLSGGSGAGRVSTNASNSFGANYSVTLVTPVNDNPKNTPPPDALIIPAVAHAGGINSQFQSDVRVSNTSPQLVTYQLTFTPSGDSGIADGQQSTFSIEPGRTVALDDVLKSWFGTGDGSAMGTLEIRPLTQTLTSTSGAAFSGLANLLTFASSRTFNLTANGTFGQYIPAIPYANFVGRAAEGEGRRLLSLQQIAQSSQYRTNLGVVEGSGEPAELVVRVFGENGQYLTEFPLNLKGGQHLQLNAFLRNQGIDSLSDGRVEVEVVSGDGKVTAYASVLDNQTSDPLLVTPVTVGETGATKWVVPGVADLVSGFANWQTDMRLFNAGTADVEATLSFYSQGGGEPKVRTLTIPAGQVRQFDRTLASLFETTNDGGAVHITTNDPAKLIATARTYNQTGAGTYGQFISAVTPAEAAGVDSRPLQLLQVEETNRFRSNIGFAEVTGKPVTIEISVVPPDAKFTALTELTLAPNEFRQLGSLLQSMGLGDTHNARVTVRAISGEGRITAYASVIDMQTNDPTYIPAQ